MKLTIEDMIFDRNAQENGLVPACPFCGNKYEPTLTRVDEKLCRYVCVRCGCDGPTGHGPVGALSNWSRRSNPNNLPTDAAALFSDVLHQLSTDLCLECIPGAPKYVGLTQRLRTILEGDPLYAPRS